MAELLGELETEEEEEGGTANSNAMSLSLGKLDLTTGFGAEVHPNEDEEDALALMMSGLDLELIKYADHDVVRNIMRSEASDLKDRARSVEAKLQAVEMESISDYVAESDNLLALHAQIQGCDSILGTMESLLSGFKNDLGKISSEIKTLQEQSLGMSIKLRNRKAAERRLGVFVEEITVPPELITSVLEEDVTEGYLEHLVDLDRRLGFIDATRNLNASNNNRNDDESSTSLVNVKTSAAADDVRP